MASPFRLTPRRFAGLVYLGTTCCLAWTLSGCKGGPDHFTLSVRNPLSRPLREDAETSSVNQTAAAGQDASGGERSLEFSGTGSEPVNPVSWSSTVPDRIPADAVDAESADHGFAEPGQGESAASTNWLRRFFSRDQLLPRSNDGVRSVRRAEESRDSQLFQESTSQNRGSYFAQVMIRGRSLERAERLDEARKVYERFIDVDPGHYAPYYRLGLIADRQNRDDEALVLYRHAARLCKRDPDVFHDLGNCLLEQGSFGKAEKAVLRAVLLSPTDARYRRTLGTIYGFQGRYEEAIEQLQFGDSEAGAYYRLSFVLAAQDDLERVRECFLLALEVDPSHQPSRRGLDLLGEPYSGDPPSPAELAQEEVAMVGPRTDEVCDRPEDAEAASRDGQDVLSLLKQACEEVSRAGRGLR